MEKKLKAFRTAALLSVMGGATVLMASGSAQAELRLHSSSTMKYGLVAPASASSSNGGDAYFGTKSTMVADFSAAKTTTPPIEDPELPPYNGDSVGSKASTRSVSR